jgi:hypothetical protein
VAVDDDGVPAEGVPAALELRHVVIPHRRPALAEAVDVGDAAEAVEAIHRADIGRLPDRPFGRFAVAEQHVGAVVRGDAAGVERGADGGADAWPSDPVRRRQTAGAASMSFEIRRAGAA